MVLSYAEVQMCAPVSAGRDSCYVRFYFGRETWTQQTQCRNETGSVHTRTVRLTLATIISLKQVFTLENSRSSPFLYIEYSVWSTDIASVREALYTTLVKTAQAIETIEMPLFASLNVLFLCN